MHMTTSTKTDIMVKFDKMRSALRWRLLGQGFHVALAAFEFTSKLNIDKDGNLMLRKDRMTPKFYHEVRQALHAFTLKDVTDLEGLIVTILLHDVMEDFGIDMGLIADKFGEKNFQSAWAMTKKYQGVTKSPEQVFMDIGNDRNASLAKLLDRIDNFQSMPGVFTQAKQLAYIEEGEVYFLPMAKRARQRFTQQNDAYFNVITVLRYQIELLKLINAVSTSAS